MSDIGRPVAAQSFLGGRVQVHAGDCLAVLRAMPAGAVDSVVTDPPYELGFMGRAWDSGSHAHTVELWSEVLRVLKPGSFCAAFAATKTYHRLACAVEDAGFQIFDMVAWITGQGFPKVGYIRDNQGVIVREGWAGSLKPSLEPIVLARRPLIGTLAENVLAHGVGGLNIDQCRVASTETWGPQGTLQGGDSLACYGDGLNNSGRSGSNAAGRWPANVCHDNSPEVVAAFPETGPSPGNYARTTSGKVKGDGWGYLNPETQNGFGDSGSAARFFASFPQDTRRFLYTSKAADDDRLGSRHPTIKPVDLLCWLVRLVTPPGGTVLDCFAGTGTTAEAAIREGMRAVLVEREPEYLADIARRMDLALGGPDERRHATIKAKGKVEHAGPLFAEIPDL
jgi:site-specific DNA-methyltransferase (adenine-specific)